MVSLELYCIACPKSFCCSDCRKNHEKITHGIEYDCPICRYQKLACSENNLKNKHFLKHLVDDHLPLHCSKCERFFNKMEDFDNIDKCVTISELVSQNEVSEVESNILNEVKEIDERFNSLYEKVVKDMSDKDTNESDNYEAIVSLNKSSRTAVITPIIRNKLVQYESSSDDDENPNEVESYKGPHTPHPKLLGKSPRIKRSATPHIKKLLQRQLAKDVGDSYEDMLEQTSVSDVPKENTAELLNLPSDGDPSTTPSRNDGEGNENPLSELRTPKAQMIKEEMMVKLASAVTTSTPTHPSRTAQWSLFNQPGTESPLSEIEGNEDTSSPVQSTDHESTKLESSSKPNIRKLKSIIITDKRRSSQDSSEKQVTFADSVNSSESSRIKRVKFAEDTKFDNGNLVKRVFRRPKRLLTPGPQKINRYNVNPRFQALLNRFENHGMTLARTPVFKRIENQENLTPATTELANLPARAINFKDDSPTIEPEKSLVPISPGTPGNELFKSCLEPSPMNPDLNTAIAAFTNNVAGSLQTCLSSALSTNDDATEIQFKFVITKKRVSVRRIVDDGHGKDEQCTEFPRDGQRPEENIWSTITKAVKNVFWGAEGMTKEALASTTPLTTSRSWSSSSSGSKRKFSEISDSDLSPLNHKRHKYEGRIRGRRPLRMTVAGLKISHSAEQSSLVMGKGKDDLNQSL